jgi:hypothetical protein
MQEDERDLLEVLIFDEIEETVGTWLRAIIQRLERQQTAIRRDRQKPPTPSRETLRGTPLYQKRRRKSARPGASDCAPTASSSEFGPIGLWQTRVKATPHTLP